MKKSQFPFVSIIILNYFGEKVIKNVINSLVNLNYPSGSFEIIVVDNNSQDKSLEILEQLKTKLPNLTVMPLSKNLGFSRGNNVGIKVAKGEYVALLNNDCVVSKNWLSNLVSTAQKNSKVFAVASKILLYQKYYELNVPISSDIEPFYSYVSKSALYNFGGKRLYFNSYLENGSLQAQIPYDPVSDTLLEIQMLIHYKKSPTRKIKDIFSGLSKSITVKDYKIQKKDILFTLEIDLKSKISIGKSISKIQNAGIIPFQDGYARDIGAIVRDRTQYYEYDEGQFDKETEVYAFCGAAVLLSKEGLDKIGLLDETFFMYYEDVEISERARLNGYQIIYSPKAEVRHIHALSSKEGSKFFIYQVEKGRLLHVFYNFPSRVFIRQYVTTIFIVIYGLMNILMSLKYLKAIYKDKSQDKPNFGRTFQLLRVSMYFLINLPYLILKRYKKKSNKNIIENNYQQITSGKWYFN